MSRKVAILSLMKILTLLAIGRQACGLPDNINENCLNLDMDEIETYLSKLDLTKVPTFEIMIGGFQCSLDALPFGALKSDWARLLLLHGAQPKGSILRKKLEKLMRILIVAYYQMEERFDVPRIIEEKMSSTGGTTLVPPQLFATDALDNITVAMSNNSSFHDNINLVESSDATDHFPINIDIGHLNNAMDNLTNNITEAILFHDKIVSESESTSKNQSTTLKIFKLTSTDSEISGGTTDGSNVSDLTTLEKVQINPQPASISDIVLGKSMKFQSTTSTVKYRGDIEANTEHVDKQPINNTIGNLITSPSTTFPTNIKSDIEEGSNFKDSSSFDGISSTLTIDDKLTTDNIIESNSSNSERTSNWSFTEATSVIEDTGKFNGSSNNNSNSTEIWPKKSSSPIVAREKESDSSSTLFESTKETAVAAGSNFTLIKDEISTEESHVKEGKVKVIDFHRVQEASASSTISGIGVTTDLNEESRSVSNLSSRETSVVITDAATTQSDYITADSAARTATRFNSSTELSIVKLNDRFPIVINYFPPNITHSSNDNIITYIKHAHSTNDRSNDYPTTTTTTYESVGKTKVAPVIANKVPDVNDIPESEFRPILEKLPIDTAIPIPETKESHISRPNVQKSMKRQSFNSDTDLHHRWFFRGRGNNENKPANYEKIVCQNDK